MNVFLKQVFQNPFLFVDGVLVSISQVNFVRIEYYLDLIIHLSVVGSHEQNQNNKSFLKSIRIKDQKNLLICIILTLSQMQNQLERTQNQRLRRNLQEDINRLEAELQDIRQELANRLKQSQEQLQALEKQKKELMEKRQEVIDNEMLRKQIQLQIRELNKEKERLQADIQQASNQIRENESLISSLQSQIQALSELLNRLNTEDQETKNSLKQKADELMRNEAELAQETEKLQQLDSQIRSLQTQINLYLGRKRLNKQEKQTLENLRKDLKSKKQERGTVKSVVSKFKFMINGLNQSIGGLSADSMRICAEIRANQQVATVKKEYLGTTEARQRAEQQKFQNLTGVRDATKQKIEQQGRNHTENLQRGKEMKADIQMKEDVCMKQDKVYQQMMEEANQMKGEEKLLKRDIRERNQQKNSI